jgi:hypothetical protein
MPRLPVSSKKVRERAMAPTESPARPSADKAPGTSAEPAISGWHVDPQCLVSVIRKERRSEEP